MTGRWRMAGRAGLVAVGAAIVGAFALAVPAGAHVTVNPTDAVQGGYARLAFRVPTESDTASTTKLEVHLPDDAPVPSVSTMPVPGWTVSTQTRKLDKPLDVHGAPVSEVVSVITWTATGDAAIKPGQFQEFPVSMGPLPKVDAMIFRTLQYYSDGSTVRWIDPPAADGKEAENPAPLVKVKPAPAEGGANAQTGNGSSNSGASVSNPSGTAAGDDTDDGANGMALGLGIGGLVAGLAGLVLGGLAFARTRRVAPEAGPSSGGSSAGNGGSAAASGH